MLSHCREERNSTAPLPLPLSPNVQGETTLYHFYTFTPSKQVFLSKSTCFKEKSDAIYVSRSPACSSCFPQHFGLGLPVALCLNLWLLLKIYFWFPRVAQNSMQILYWDISLNIWLFGFFFTLQPQNLILNSGCILKVPRDTKYVLQNHRQMCIKWFDVGLMVQP